MTAVAKRRSAPPQEGGARAPRVDLVRQYLEEQALADMRSQYFLRQLALHDKATGGKSPEWMVRQTLMHIKTALAAARVVLGDGARGRAGIGLHSLEERAAAIQAAQKRYLRERQAGRCQCGLCDGTGVGVTPAWLASVGDRAQEGER